MQKNGFLGENKAMQTIRARLAFHARQNAFDRTAKRLIQGTPPAATDRLVAELYAYWGDPLNQADERFLRSCLAEAQRAEHAVLQCGTSLATLLLGGVCDQQEAKDKQLWCLEDNRHWAGLMRSWLTEYQIRKAHIIHSRARLYGEYVWYSVDPERLAKRVSLLICDGNRATPQGVVGALARLGQRLDSSFVVLARNVGAPELKQLAQWGKSRGASCVLVDKAEGFLKIASKARAEEAPPLPESHSGSKALKTARG